jgi:hypothetical protein
MPLVWHQGGADVLALIPACAVSPGTLVRKLSTMTLLTMVLRPIPMFQRISSMFVYVFSQVATVSGCLFFAKSSNVW